MISQDPRYLTWWWTFHSTNILSIHTADLDQPGHPILPTDLAPDTHTFDMYPDTPNQIWWPASTNKRLCHSYNQNALPRNSRMCGETLNPSTDLSFRVEYFILTSNSLKEIPRSSNKTLSKEVSCYLAALSSYQSRTSRSAAPCR